MTKLVEIVTARWLVTLIGALALALLVWFLAPFIAIGGYRPFESDLVRAAIAAAILVGWGLVNILGQARAASRNEKMIAAIGGAGGEPSPGDAESARLRARLEDALRELRRLRGAKRRGRAYLYELPWYVLIGPPGSGKTTALTHSGLSFPLADRFGRGPLRGASGTRNCDWFLTDEAVLLDTAGRYTTQDSDEAADRAAWRAFLDLLKEYRPRQPINGAIVAISLTDLATLPEPEQKAHARAIRARLAELQERFGVRFPVYVLFTKADLIAGFVESFENLTREEREQVWGMTFPLATGEDDDLEVTGFDPELRGLLGRLQERMIERVQQEADLRRRGLVFGFPTQLASLAEPAREFLEEIFRASRYEARLLLRGVYFTSGTQEGTPIDRLMAALVQRFGLHQTRLTAHSGTGRSYFLTRLLREVIFAEASIVSANPRVERRDRWIRRAVYAGCALVAVGACTAWTVSYVGNRALEQRVRGTFEGVKAETAQFDAPVLPDADPARTLPALAALSGLPAGYTEAGRPVPLSLRFGLYQGRKIGSEEIAAYERGLNLLLLPRLLARLQEQLQTRLRGRWSADPDTTDFVYQALKIYLMLGGEHPLDRSAIREWMALDWEAAYPGPNGAAIRTALLGHLDALLQTPLTAYPLDGRLVEAARQALAQTPLAQRAYLMLKERAASANLREWRISDHAGPAAGWVLARRSGKLLSDGLPGFYTREGFYDFVLPHLPDAVRLVQEDSWVLGPMPHNADWRGADVLEPDILNLYYADYIERWDALIGDVTVTRLRGREQTAETLNLISGPTSPLRLLWRSIAEETRLSQPPAGGAAQAAAAPQTPSRVGAPLLPAAAAAQPKYGLPVDEHFRLFQQFVGGADGGPAPGDAFLKNVADLYAALNRAPVAPGGTIAEAGEVAAVARRIEDGAAAMPAPVAAIARRLAQSATGIGVGGAKDQLDADWQSKVLPLCQSALDGRYPVRRGAAADIAPDDFARLFAPNGLIDSFFNSELRPLVDTSRATGQANGPEQGGIPISKDALRQFQTAARIRDSFFASGPTMQSRFEITPLSLDPGAKRATLSIDGQKLVYDGAAAQPSMVQWPGTGNVRESVVSVEGTDGVTATIERAGPWSWLRLLDLGHLESLGQPDRWRVAFSVGSHRVVFEIDAGSIANPLAAVRDLERFHCPRSL
jgi:type VI secretion system protein ImpL